MRNFQITALTLAAAIAAMMGEAALAAGGYGAPGRVQGPVGVGVYRPGYGPGYGYGGWRYGYPGYGGWRYGYPGYGYGYGFGLGLGLGYGAGWAYAASPWYWGAPAAVYGGPGFFPYTYMAAGYPALVLGEELSFVQRPSGEAAPTRPAASYWYYCTEPAGYYPYVHQCTRPWIALVPQSVPPAGSAPGTEPAQ